MGVFSRPLAGPSRAVGPAIARAGEAADGQCDKLPCLGPEQLRAAYFPGEAAQAPADRPQTIALVDAYNDYAIAEDLETYDREFGVPELQACASQTARSCLEVVNQKGESPVADPGAELPFPQDETQLKERQRTCEESQQPLVNAYNKELREIKEIEEHNGGKEPTRKELEEVEAKNPRKRVSEAGELACDEVEGAEGWSLEISLDVQTAHAICRNCKILLVEAGRPSAYNTLREYEEDPPFSEANLAAAEDVATARADEVSNSWGGGEPIPESKAQEREAEEFIQTFIRPGKVITAAAGDDGYLEWGELAEAEAEYESCKEFAAILETTQEREEEEARCEEISFFEGPDFPATSPTVIAAGGTTLKMKGDSYEGESVWNDQPVREGPEAGEEYGAGGGGCSDIFRAPPWQTAAPDWSRLGCGESRATNDIAADADPFTGLAVYDSAPELGLVESEEAGKEGELEFRTEPLKWLPVGGTSASSPLIAAMFGLAGGANDVAYPAQTLYEHLDTASLHDVTLGGNGECDNDYSSGCTGSMTPLAVGTPSEGLFLLPFDCGQGTLICNAAPGCGGQRYDGPTGVGTPDGIAAFEPGVDAEPKLAEPACPGEGGTKGTEAPPAESAKPPPPVTESAARPKIHKARRKPRISKLRLTKRAKAAVRHGRCRISTLRISFELSARAKVKVTLLERVRVRHQVIWARIGTRLRINGKAGHHRIRLRGHLRLRRGRYEIKLLPAGGKAASLRFRVL